MLTDCVVDSEIMIDRSAKLFEHVYAYLLDDRYPYPQKYYTELDYYLVPYDIDKLYDCNKLLLNEIKKDIAELKDATVELKNNLTTIRNEIDKSPRYGQKKCIYSGCNNNFIYGQLTCYKHDGSCCYYSCYYNKYCENDTYDRNAYCDDHMFDHGDYD